MEVSVVSADRWCHHAAYTCLSDFVEDMFNLCDSVYLCNQSLLALGLPGQARSQTHHFAMQRRAEQQQTPSPLLWPASASFCSSSTSRVASKQTFSTFEDFKE